MKGLFRRLWARSRSANDQPLWRAALWGWNTASGGGGGGNTGALTAPVITSGEFIKD